MEDFMRVSDVAARLQIQKSRAYFLISTNEIPAIRVGGAIRIPRSAWEKWLAEKENEALITLRQTKAASSGMETASTTERPDLR